MLWVERDPDPIELEDCTRGILIRTAHELTSRQVEILLAGGLIRLMRRQLGKAAWARVDAGRTRVWASSASHAPLSRDAQDLVTLRRTCAAPIAVRGRHVELAIGADYERAQSPMILELDIVLDHATVTTDANAVQVCTADRAPAPPPKGTDSRSRTRAKRRWTA